MMRCGTACRRPRQSWSRKGRKRWPGSSPMPVSPGPQGRLRTVTHRFPSRAHQQKPLQGLNRAADLEGGDHGRWRRLAVQREIPLYTLDGVKDAEVSTHYIYTEDKLCLSALRFQRGE